MEETVAPVVSTENTSEEVVRTSSTTDTKEMKDFIRERAKNLGLSQGDLAKRCGWSASRISFYMTGRQIPGPKSFAVVAKALEMNEEEKETYIKAAAQEAYERAIEKFYDALKADKEG